MLKTLSNQKYSRGAHVIGFEINAETAAVGEFDIHAEMTFKALRYISLPTDS
jgi:hypothetical protein